MIDIQVQNFSLTDAMETHIKNYKSFLPLLLRTPKKTYTLLSIIAAIELRELYEKHLNANRH